MAQGTITADAMRGAETSAPHLVPDARSAQAPSHPSPLLLDELTREFLNYLGSYRNASPNTIVAYRHDLRRLHSFLTSHRLPTDVDKITGRHLQAFAVSMTGLSSSTIARALHATSSLFSYLVRLGHLDRNPVAQVEMPKKCEQRPYVPTHEECRDLVAATPDVRERAMLLLLLTGGLRRGELLSLKRRDISTDATEVTVTGKGPRTRTIPLPHQTAEALSRHLAETDTNSEYAFPSRAGTQMRATTFYRLFRRILHRAG
ncbi:MAG: tyrosine-type recombinase/integrase, partial [Dehalococcoidia bacterium]|nr:tyrosine-type recombinase/integrase [Dehalococcoidia bacterium]